MKYIDADKLIAEVEKISAEHTSRWETDEVVIAFDKLEDFIISLQQEQPEVDFDKLALEKYPETTTYDSRGLYDRKKYYRDIYKQGLKDGYNLKHKIRNDSNNL